MIYCVLRGSEQLVGTDSWDHYVLAEQTPPGICYFDEENVRPESPRLVVESIPPLLHTGFFFFFFRDLVAPVITPRILLCGQFTDYGKFIYYHLLQW